MKPLSSKSAIEKNARADEKTRLSLSDFLPYRLNVLATLVSEGLARSYSERFGISIAEWRVIATIGEIGSVTAKAIGHHAHMNKVKVSRAVTSLEGRGLIRRAPNADDLREAFLVFTLEGQAIYEAIVPLAEDYVANLTDGFSAAERDQLDRLINKLTARTGLV